MQRIETLHENVGLPLKIGPSATAEAPLPPAVTDRIKQGRLWHLVVWSDDDSGTVGLWHQGRSIVFHRGELDGLSIDLMRQAKGSGWVALEAKVRGMQAPVTVLQTTSFSADALAWLLQHHVQISQVFGHDIAVCDRGSDY